jgi:acyl-CoA synthetase (AMP-forming)/AMP-acid ligase II
MQMTQGLRRAAMANRDGTASVFAGRRPSWGELLARVTRLAAGIRGLGIGPGDRVAILALNSDRYLEFFYAVSWAGAVFVPVNTRLAGPEIVFWLNDSESRLLFVDEQFLEPLGRVRGELTTVEQAVYIGEGAAPAGTTHHEALIEASAAMDDAGRADDDLAGIFYTGGTTGRSKGVMLSHANLVTNALNGASVVGIDRNSSYLHAAPMFHLADGALAFAITMMGGRHCYLAHFDPEAVLKSLQDEAVTLALLVPTMVNMLVQHPKVGDYDLSKLQKLMYGASPMPEAVARRAMQLLPQVGFIQGYGQTECAPILTLLTPEFHVTAGPKAGRMTSVGHPVPACEVSVRDENDEPCPPGVVGEVCGRGPNVMLGYWKQPELTAHTLRNGWLHTGDGGYLDQDGFLYIVDRMKDMIISGGENVYSAEVESALHQHPAVAECAVIGVPDQKWGERVHAIVRLKPGHAAGAEDLIAHCHQLIAGYKCPRSLDFREQPLPLSGAGKILKTELRKPYWEGKSKRVN